MITFYRILAAVMFLASVVIDVEPTYAVYFMLGAIFAQLDKKKGV